ncbi:MAG: ABC transporter substrate-binding protein [Clostridia bacterium]|nr:ABC transporter substrate-binding protein [Clostridia bacterium]
MKLLPLLLAIVLLFTSCGIDVSSLVPNTEPEIESSAPVVETETSTLAIVSQARPNQTFGVGYVRDGVLDPFEPGHQMNYHLSCVLYDRLFVIGPDGSPLYALCDSLTSEDSYTYTLTIHPNVSFHNGTPLTAADVVYSLNRARNSSLYGQSLSLVSYATYDNPTHTVVITLKKPLGSLPALLTFPIVSSAGGLDYEYHNYALLGSGRYYIDIEIMEETEYTYLQSYSDWYGDTGQKSAVPRIDLYTVSNRDDLVHRYFNSDIDVLSLSSFQNESLVLQGYAEKRLLPGNNLMYIGFNTSLQSFSSPESRLAIYNLVDREELSALLGEQNVFPVQYPIQPTSRTATFLTDSLTPDPENTSSLLRKAGFANTRGSRELEFLSTEFTLTLLACNESTTAVTVANYLKEKLESVNFSVELNLCDYKTYIDCLDKGNFNLYIGTTNPAANCDYEYLIDYADLFASLQQQINNQDTAGKSAGVSDGLRDSLSAIQALKTYDPLYSMDLAEHIQSMFDEYMPFVPLFFDSSTVYLRGNFVSGVELTSQDIFYNIERWKAPK